MMVMVKVHNIAWWVAYVQREGLPVGCNCKTMNCGPYNYRTTFTQEQCVMITVLESA